MLKRVFMPLALSLTMVFGAAACEPASGPGYDTNNFHIREEMGLGFARHIQENYSTYYWCTSNPNWSTWQGDHYRVEASCLSTTPGKKAQIYGTWWSVGGGTYVVEGWNN